MEPSDLHHSTKPGVVVVDPIVGPNSWTFLASMYFFGLIMDRVYFPALDLGHSKWLWEWQCTSSEPRTSEASLVFLFLHSPLIFLTSPWEQNTWVNCWRKKDELPASSHQKAHIPAASSRAVPAAANWNTTTLLCLAWISWSLNDPKTWAINAGLVTEIWD